MSTALSIAMHAAVLAAALGFVVARVTPERLIRVSIAAGGGTDSTAGGSPGGAAPHSSAPESPPAPAVEAAKSAPQPRTRGSRPRVRRRTQPAPDDTAADAAPQLDETRPATAGASLPGGGQGEGIGLAGGSGAGLGGGFGGGNGTGAGGGDQRAHCLYCPEPQYPLVARRRGWEGIVHVGLSVLADGTVEDASLRQSSGYSVLDRAAVEVARQSRFTPPVSLGLPAPLHGRIEYRFQLSNMQ